jgi:LysM repeat protein
MRYETEYRKPRNNKSARSSCVFAVGLVLGVALLLGGAPARAKRATTHTVRPGQSIAIIARKHGVSQEDLLEVNGLKRDAVIQPGDVLELPDALKGGWTKSHVVEPGDTLSGIAHRYKVTVADLKRVNRIGRKGRLKVGRRLVIPKGRQVTGRAAVPRSGDGTEEDEALSGRPDVPRWDGKATVVRVKDNERAKMTVFDHKGRVRTYAKRRISQLARSRRDKVHPIHPRLVKLIGEVAKRYPGHEIEIISGYRPHRRGHRRSYHARGRALDFRVRGVTNLELYLFIKTFEDVGCGYYPSSTFVHLDIRDSSYAWTDFSGPGEPARYAKPGEAGTPEAMARDAEPAEEISDPGEEEATPDPENFE